MTPPASFGTERLQLSRLSDADVDDLTDLLTKEPLYTYIGEAPASADEARTRVERWLRGSAEPDVLWINYVARSSDDRRLVGLAQATVFLDDEPECSLAYLVHPDEQRQGFGVEMMREFAAQLGAAIAPARFTSNIHPGHAASERLAAALGLVRTDELVDGEHVWISPAATSTSR